MGRCDVCEVDIPGGDEHKERHEAGKKHLHQLAQKEYREDLGRRSIFVRVTDVPDGEVITYARLECFFKNMGDVARLILREHYSIVEFKNSCDAEKALKYGTLGVKWGEVHMERRKVDFTKKSDPKHLNIAKMIESLSPIKDFDQQVIRVTEQVVLSEEEAAERIEIADHVQKQLEAYFVKGVVTVFGSSITQVGTKESDVDASFDMENSGLEKPERDKYTLLTSNAEVFKTDRITAEEMQHLTAAERARLLCKIINEVRKDSSSAIRIGQQRPVLDARCPVVRFLVYRNNKKAVLVDLSTDNRLGCSKSKYLRDLILADESGKLRLLLIAFRFWAHTNGLFEPSEKQHKGHFNAYMLNLLLIRYMQFMKLLPVIQFGENEVNASSWRIDYSIPPYSLASLDIQSFLRFFFVHVIESPLGKVVYTAGETPRMEKNMFEQRFLACIPDFKYGYLNVQDPLEQTHNVTQNITDKSVRLMRQKMMLSVNCLKEQGCKFQDIFSIEPPTRPTTPLEWGPVDIDTLATLDEVPGEYDMPKIANICSMLMTRLLGFEEDLTHEVKRMRIDPETSDSIWESPIYIARHELHIGRRNVRRKLANERKELSDIELELETSRALLMQSPGNKEIAKLNLATCLDNTRRLMIGFKRIDGSAVDTKNIFHFLEQFLRNNWQTVFKVSAEEAMDEA